MRRRQKRRIALFLLFSFCAAFLAVTWLRLVPTVERLAMAQAADEASNLIAVAVAEQMELSDISYGKIVRLEKDAAGRLLALQTDLNEINRLRNLTLARVNAAVLEAGDSELGIPLGNILFPAIFSGHGPELPVRIISVQNAGAEFDSSFEAAGINQTLHRIEMKVSLDITLLTPAGIREVCADSTITVAETILVGQVPSTMIHTNRNGE